MLSTWQHSGFHVFCGNHISPDDETAMENLARDIIYPEGHKQAYRFENSKNQRS